MTDSNRPGEQPAVRTTIVGGRPPGSGKSVGQIPRGIEILIKKAAVDPAFRNLLLTHRAAAADEIGLRLEPAEVFMLNAAPAEQLAAVIAQTPVEPSAKPALLGKVAAVMLAALGLVATNDGCVSTGHAADLPTTQPSGRQTSPATLRPGDLQVIAGELADKPGESTTQQDQPRVRMAGVQPMRGAMADRPVAAPAIEDEGPAVPMAGVAPGPLPPRVRPIPPSTSQPATSQPAVSVDKEEVKRLLAQLDSNKYAEHEAAFKRLKDLAPHIQPMLRDALKSGKLSDEAVGCVQALIAMVGPGGEDPDFPAQVMRGVRADLPVVRAGVRVDRPVTSQPASQPGVAPGVRMMIGIRVEPRMEMAGARADVPKPPATSRKEE